MEIKVSENFEQMLHGALDATNEILQDYELDDAQNKYYRDVWECLQNFSLMIKFGYFVRKLTPVECARLQGFPDWWCSDLETDSADVTEDELAFWRGVFETHRRLVTHSAKAKTDRQILKWLSDPHTDAAEYKMWGNGVALPCVQWIMQQIVRVVEDSDD